MIHLYKYYKKLYMGLMVIIENKIKCVNGGKSVGFSPCYTYPPKCLCTTILEENWMYHKIIKTKYEKQTVDYKWKTSHKWSVQCVWCSRVGEQN